MLVWEVYWQEMHARRAAELMEAVRREQLVREAMAARRTAQELEPRALPQATPLTRRALAAAGCRLVHLGQWLEQAAEQPSL